MGATLARPDVKGQLSDLARQAEEAQRQLQLDLAQSALDAAGIVDPTPISDGLGALLSAARGDWVGAGLSVVSMLPYAGDALGKTAKGARVMAKIAEARAVIADSAIKARQIIANALNTDTAAIRAQRALKQANRIEDSVVNGCKVGGNRFGSQSPTQGWVKGERGDGLWDPSASGMKQGRLDEINAVTGGKPLPFKDGYPDFSAYRAELPAANGRLVSGDVEIAMAGSNKIDFAAADRAMADKLGTGSFTAPDGMTWHHNPNGTTMELVPSALHNNVPHTGGASLARDPGY